MLHRGRRLRNRVALITGASRGLGKAIAIRFAEEGAIVAINYMTNQELGEQVADSIISSGGRALAVHADVSDPVQVGKMIQRVLKEFNQIDILVNNAGVGRPSPCVLDASLEDLDWMIRVNLKGVVHCVLPVARTMREKQYGRIINIASIAGLGTAFPGSSFYAPTKAAVISLTKRLALEFGSYKITVNCIAPGYIGTDTALRDGVLPEFRNQQETMAQRSMLGRIGQPEDIANAVVFLASDEASFITAQTLTIDGGRKDFLSHSA